MTDTFTMQSSAFTMQSSTFTMQSSTVGIAFLTSVGREFLPDFGGG
jgi:hypothetical protein